MSQSLLLTDQNHNLPGYRELVEVIKKLKRDVEEVKTSQTESKEGSSSMVAQRRGSNQQFPLTPRRDEDFPIPLLHRPLGEEWDE